MATPRSLVGRDAELDVLVRAVRALVDGPGCAATVEGEAGIGKTRLVDDLVAEATARGVAVARGHAHPFERTRPFGLIRRALGLSPRASDPERAAIGALLAGGRGTDRAAGAGAGEVRYRAVEAIVELLERQCAEEPVLLVVEDLHWADGASLLTVSSVARQLALSPLMVVATSRPAPVSAEVAHLLDELSDGGRTALRLRPLTAGEVGAMAAEVLGAPPGPALLELLGKAGGNPLWVDALLRSLVDDGALRPADGVVEATTTELPSSLSDLVVRRLQHLAPTTLELLRATAVLGDAVPVRDVAAVTGRSPGEVVGGLAEAYDARLLDESEDRVVFRHQLVQDAIYHHVPLTTRRVLHRDAALALVTAGADRLDVANHIMLGAERGDAEAVTWLRRAAGEAADREPTVAVELCRRAEALLPPDHPLAGPVALDLVLALLRAGRLAEATDRAEAQLGRSPGSELEGPLRTALVVGLALQNRAAEVVAWAGSSLARADLPPTEAVPLLAQQSWALTSTGDARGGEQAAARAVALAESAADAPLTAWGLVAESVAIGRQGRFGDALACARRAVALAAGAPGSFPLQPTLFLGLALFDCDLVAEARSAYREAFDDEGSGWWLSDALVPDAQAAFAVGEWDDALPRLIAGEQAAREKGHPLLVSQAQAHRAVIATATGDLRTAGQLVAGLSAPEADAHPYNAGMVAFAAASLRLAEGDDVGAHDVLLRCWRRDAASGDRYYHRSLAPDLVRLAVRLGQPDLAEEVAAVVADSAALAPDVPTVRALALRCRALVDGDVDAAVEAVALARTVPHLIEHAGACEDAALLLGRGGRGTDAARLLEEALDRYSGAGAERWAARARARLRELGVHPGPRGSRRRPTRGWGSLTDTERAVSLLVAEGLTNSAVARRLYMSPHTVNTHLRHVFAKLDVANRVALAGVVHRSIE